VDSLKPAPFALQDNGETMKNNLVRNTLVGLASIAVVFGSSSSALADDLAPMPLPVTEPVVVSLSSPEVLAEIAVVTVSSKSLSWLQTTGSAAIAKRQTTLSGLSTKLSVQKKDCGANAAVQAEVSRTSTSLNTLGAALAASTDVKAARTFYRQIFGEHRVYALVVPKVGVVERCDTQLLRSEALGAEATRLQGLIDKAKAEGVNVIVAQLAKDSAVATLSTVNPVPSQATVISLVPDRGDKALLGANSSALKAANAQLDASLLQQRTVNAQLDAVRAALRQDLKVDAAQDKLNAKLAIDARKAAAAAERAAQQAAALAAREAKRVVALPIVSVAG
jgi:hypothetical protein